MPSDVVGGGREGADAFFDVEGDDGGTLFEGEEDLSVWEAAPGLEVFDREKKTIEDEVFDFEVVNPRGKSREFHTDCGHLKGVMEGNGGVEGLRDLGKISGKKGHGCVGVDLVFAEKEEKCFTIYGDGCSGLKFLVGEEVTGP